MGEGVVTSIYVVTSISVAANSVRTMHGRTDKYVDCDLAGP